MECEGEGSSCQFDAQQRTPRRTGSCPGESSGEAMGAEGAGGRAQSRSKSGQSGGEAGVEQRRGRGGAWQIDGRGEALLDEAELFSPDSGEASH